MRRIYFHFLVCCAGCGCFCGCRAASDSANAFFFDSLTTQYFHEYRECSGETRGVDLQKVIAWKRKNDEYMRSVEYAEILRDYRKSSDSATAIPPCKLVDWAKARKHAQDSLENAAVKKILDTNDAADAHAELASYAKSAMDFADIPFGVSKRTFAYFFKKKFAREVSQKDGFFYCESFPVGGKAFLMAFYFNAAGELCKYEIESDPQPAHLLNPVVRPAMEHLASFYEKRIGPPQRSFHVGYFDIKSRELAVCRKWEISNKTVFIGLCLSSYQYYAKAIVSDIGFLSVKPAAPGGESAEFQEP